ncbi:uncharacterized protein A4U43_C03F13900 [Asparagus officinalis]|uniref:Uncharacterized protein n=1 Tax=Asparagus officinalis TaxID=4686 RepID=A0A5P1FAG1_ASPOF|nr:uncharacterized protein LOC109833653 [Asparagus officinalis]ONK75152.1 uncharacterized protein A4U43_C03F13900 [Asparagus officinalis]
MAIWGDDASINLDDFSPSSTLVPFDTPIPLLRGPIPAAPSDDPGAGPFVLAFNSASSWRSAFESTRSKLVDQCMAGARVGCSISASNKCKPPWWKTLFGASVADYAEREKCEEMEIASCLEASAEQCIKFAKEKCIAVFRDARIASSEWKGASHLVFSASRNPNDDSLEANIAEIEQVHGPEG